MQREATYGSSGKITTFGVSVWERSNISIRVTSIDWGVLSPGENKTVSYFIRNDSNFRTTLELSTESWNPANASDFIFLSWNLENVYFDIDQTSVAIFTLRISPDIHGIDSFSFDIIIST